MAKRNSTSSSDTRDKKKGRGTGNSTGTTASVPSAAPGRTEVPLYRDDPESSTFFQKNWKPLFVVIAVALIARVAHFLFLRANDPSFAITIPGVDSNTYNQWAQKIVAGDWASRDQPVFYYGPIYPYFLAGIYSLFGHSFALVHAAQFLLGVVTSGVVYVGTGQWFSRRVAFGAGLFMALCPGVLFYEGTLLPEAISFLAIATFLCLLGLTQNHPQRLGLWGLTGLTLGVAVVQRANTLLCAGGVALWVLLYFRQWKWGRKALCFAIFLVGLGLPLLPTLLHNRILGKQWVLVTSNGPNLLYIGNAHDADGTFVYPNSFLQLEEAKKSREVSMGAELRQDIAKHPVAWARLMMKKLYLFWASYDPPDNFSYDLFRQFSPLLKVNPLGFALIVPLAFIGMGLAARRWRHVLSLYLFVLTFCGSIILIFVVGRYRLHVVSGLCGFAAMTVFYLYNLAIRKRYGKLISLAALAVFIAILLGAHSAVEFRIRPNDFGMVSRYFEEGGRVVEGINLMRQAEDYYSHVKPKNMREEEDQKINLASVRGRMADLMVRQRMFSEAEEILRQIIQEGYGQGRDLENFAQVLLHVGKQEEAILFLEAVVKSAPNDPYWQELLDKARSKEMKLKN